MLGLFKRFRKNEEGSFLILFAVGAITLVAITGAALDYSRGYLLQSELTSALDAAALAGGANASADDVDDTIEKYFKVNFPTNYMGADVEDIDVTINTLGGSLSASVTAELDYTLLSVVVDGKMSIGAETEITLEKKGMEIALVMDNTGSMYGTKMTTMKNAAQDLVDILYGDKDEVDKMWISLVPFTAAVNIGTEHSSWLTSLDQTQYYPTTWRGCVEARTDEMSDDTPTVGGKWDAFYYADNSDNDWYCWNKNGGCDDLASKSCGSSDNTYSVTSGKNKWYVNEDACARNDGSGPNLGCPPAITPLTKSRSEVEAAIAEMDSWHRGGTFSNLGLAWGWRSISPKWQGLWSGVDAAQPFDYDEPLMDKVVIILTDGDNNVYDHNGGGPYGSDYTAYGRIEEEKIGTGINTKAEGATAANTLFSQACEEMKDEGIIIYTITFKVTSSSVQNVYSNCASSAAYYFNSPDTDDLSAVFKAIGDSLSNLRISK